MERKTSEKEGCMTTRVPTYLRRAGGETIQILGRAPNFSAGGVEEGEDNAIWLTRMERRSTSRFEKGNSDPPLEEKPERKMG